MVIEIDGVQDALQAIERVVIINGRNRLMDREQIRQLIQQDKLASNSPALSGVMVRRFEELQQLDDQLNVIGSLMTDLQALIQGNQAYEKKLQENRQTMLRLNETVVQARDEYKRRMTDFSQNNLLLDKKTKGLLDECQNIRGEIEQLSNKPLEMEHLKRKKDERQEEVDNLQAIMNSFGEDYQQKVDMFNRLDSFVKSLETLEAQLGKIMEEIWSHLKNDSFDKMCDI